MSQSQNSTNLSDIFRVLGHPTKLKVMGYLLHNASLNDEPVVPTLVATDLNLTVAQTGSFMRRMSEIGLLTRSISGRYVFYKVNKQIVHEIEEYFHL